MDTFRCLSLMLLLMSSTVYAKFVPTEHYYVFDHIDVRKCMSPLCGGDFIRQVNTMRTRCSDGSWQASCYVARVDLQQINLDETQQAEVIERFHNYQAVIRGTIAQESFNGFTVPLLNTTEAWNLASAINTDASYFRVRHSGVVCITEPCNSLLFDRLNIMDVHPLAEIDLRKTKANAAQTAQAHQLMQNNGVVVRGTFQKITGPAGTGKKLVAKALFLPAVATPNDGQTCGGLMGLTCPTGQVCMIDLPNLCQAADLTGACLTPPDICTMEYAPVCGCDGVTYTNQCARQAVGIQLDHIGKCVGDGVEKPNNP